MGPEARVPTDHLWCAIVCPAFDLKDRQRKDKRALTWVAPVSNHPPPAALEMNDTPSLPGARFYGRSAAQTHSLRGLGLKGC